MWDLCTLFSCLHKYSAVTEKTLEPPLGPDSLCLFVSSHIPAHGGFLPIFHCFSLCDNVCDPFHPSKSSQRGSDQPLTPAPPVLFPDRNLCTTLNPPPPPLLCRVSRHESASLFVSSAPPRFIASPPSPSVIVILSSERQALTISKWPTAARASLACLHCSHLSAFTPQCSFVGRPSSPAPEPPTYQSSVSV